LNNIYYYIYYNIYKYLLNDKLLLLADLTPFSPSPGERGGSKPLPLRGRACPASAGGWGEVVDQRFSFIYLICEK
jgi:hypothetical protein